MIHTDKIMKIGSYELDSFVDVSSLYYFDFGDYLYYFDFGDAYTQSSLYRTRGSSNAILLVVHICIIINWNNKMLVHCDAAERLVLIVNVVAAYSAFGFTRHAVNLQFIIVIILSLVKNWLYAWNLMLKRMWKIMMSVSKVLSPSPDGLPRSHVLLSRVEPRSTNYCKRVEELGQFSAYPLCSFWQNCIMIRE
jgi:hypothetical protein